MATLREVFPAWTIRHQVLWNNNATWILEHILQDQSATIGSTINLEFEKQRDACKSYCDVINWLSAKIATVFQRVNQTSLDKGFGHIKVLQTDAENDNSTADSLCNIAKPLVDSAVQKSELETLADPFKAWLPKLNLLRGPLPYQEWYHPVLLHGILDAISYELQGINETTGELLKWNEEQTKHSIRNRIQAANVHLGHCGGYGEYSNMANAVSYVASNFEEAATLEDLAILGQYVDSRVEKIICVRRSWAL